jgi:hypothetical protein
MFQQNKPAEMPNLPAKIELSFIIRISNKDCCGSIEVSTLNNSDMRTKKTNPKEKLIKSYVNKAPSRTVSDFFNLKKPKILLESKTLSVCNKISMIFQSNTMMATSFCVTNSGCLCLIMNENINFRPKLATEIIRNLSLN